MECQSCGQDPKKIADWQTSCMIEYGWYMHYVFDDELSPFSVNIHTHGLLESFKHPDIQVCIPLPKEVVHTIFANIVSSIKDGTLVLEKNKYYDDVLAGGYKVKYIDAVENGRPVLRMILPDKAGHLEQLDMDPDTQEQYTKLDNNEA